MIKESQKCRKLFKFLSKLLFPLNKLEHNFVYFVTSHVSKIRTIYNKSQVVPQ